MFSKKSVLNVVELKKALDKEKAVNRALITLLIDRGVFTEQDLKLEIIKHEMNLEN